MAQLVRHFAHNWLVPGSNPRQVETFFRSFYFPYYLKAYYILNIEGESENCKKKKKNQLDADLNPGPLDYQQNDILIELRRHSY